MSKQGTHTKRISITSTTFHNEKAVVCRNQRQQDDQRSSLFSESTRSEQQDDQRSSLFSESKLKEIIDEMINNVYISIKTIYSDTIML